MRMGSLIDAIVFERPYVIWHGDRRSPGYKDFESKHSDQLIVTKSEYDEGAPAAAAIRSCKVAAPWLDGAWQVPMSWLWGGRKCTTGGIDVLGKNYITELKTTSSASPGAFRWHALKMGYHAQLAWYREGAFLNGNPRVDHLMIVVGEIRPPYPVVVYRLSKRAMEDGERLNTGWMERLRVCEESDEWPSYAQDIVELDSSGDHELEFDAD